MCGDEWYLGIYTDATSSDARVNVIVLGAYLVLQLIVFGIVILTQPGVVNDLYVGEEVPIQCTLDIIQATNSCMVEHSCAPYGQPQTEPCQRYLEEACIQYVTFPDDIVAVNARVVDSMDVISVVVKWFSIVAVILLGVMGVTTINRRD